MNQKNSIIYVKCDRPYDNFLPIHYQVSKQLRLGNISWPFYSFHISQQIISHNYFYFISLISFVYPYTVLLRLMESPVSFSAVEIRVSWILWWIFFSVLELGHNQVRSPTPITHYLCLRRQGGYAGPWSNTGPLSNSLCLMEKREKWTCYIIFSIRKLISGKFADHQYFLFLFEIHFPLHPKVERL